MNIIKIAAFTSIALSIVLGSPILFGYGLILLLINTLTIEV